MLYFIFALFHPRGIRDIPRCLRFPGSVHIFLEQPYVISLIIRSKQSAPPFEQEQMKKFLLSEYIFCPIDVLPSEI